MTPDPVLQANRALLFVKMLPSAGLNMIAADAGWIVISVKTVLTTVPLVALTETVKVPAGAPAPTVSIRVVLPLPVMDGGVKLAETPDGSPVAANEMVPEKPALAAEDKV